jgi:hypothetical protein
VHVARSFALKEPPSKVASQSRNNAADADAANMGKKRYSSALSFSSDPDHGDKGNGVKSDMGKKNKKHKITNDAEPDPISVRAMMMKHAARLQTNGMDAM